jgi:3-hydroxybutyryl-CoA dehydratase
MSGESNIGTEGGPFGGMSGSWSDVSQHVLNSYLEANRALIAALGFPAVRRDRATGGSALGTENGTEAGTGATARNERGPRIETAPGTPELAAVSDEWTSECSVETAEALGVGESIRFSKVLSDEDVHAFAGASGDTNRLHLDDEFAADSRFGGRIVHGTLVSGLISAALARLPGLTIYLSQDLEFRGPVRIGSTVTAECEIVEDLGGDRYRLQTQVETDDGETVIDGEAVVLIDDLPAE